MRNRFENAIAINEGACNPVAITNSLLRAMKEIRDAGGDTDTVTNSAAVRLMLNQLAWVIEGKETLKLEEHDRCVWACEEGIAQMQRMEAMKD